MSWLSRLADRERQRLSAGRKMNGSENRQIVCAHNERGVVSRLMHAPGK